MLGYDGKREDATSWANAALYNASVDMIQLFQKVLEVE